MCPDTPVYVHRSLVEKHLPYYDMFLRPTVGDDSSQVTSPKTIELFGVTRHMCVLIARFHYGQQVWDSDGVEDVDELMCCLKVLHMKCFDEIGWSFVSNACLDSIREILMQTTKVPADPIRNLRRILNGTDDDGIQMIKDILVYADCAEDGRSVRWIDVSQDERQGEFIHDLCVALAKKAVAGHALTQEDIMERCKYHTHDEDCPPCSENA